MTRSEWLSEEHDIGVIRTLVAAYEIEHDDDADPDPASTREMLDDAMKLQDRLMAKLGPCPPEPEPPPSSDECEFEFELPF